MMLNPLPNLSEIKLSENKQKNRKPCKTIQAEPVYVKKLYDHFRTGDKVGAAIGCSDATVLHGLRKKTISKVIELAAQGVYEREIAPKPTPVIQTSGKVFV